MCKSYAQSLLAAFAVCFLFSCTKTDVPGPAGPPGTDGTDGSSAITGTVYGKVELYDSLGNAITDNSGATILFENTNPQISVSSDNKGFFTSPVISSGFYNLSVSKPGYGTMKMLHFQHTGGVNPTQAGVTMLGRKPSSWFDIKTLKVDTGTENGGRYMDLTITLVHPQKLRYLWAVMYFRHLPGAGNANNDYTFRSYFYPLDDSTLVYQRFGYDMTEYTDQFNNTNDVYITVAVDNQKEFTYTDSLGNKVYPATGNLSNEVKVYNNLKN